MDFNVDSSKYTIAKGFINGRDPSGRSVYGLFIVAASSKKLVYSKELFAYEPIDADASWEILIALLERPKLLEKDPQLALYEKELHEFIDIRRLFQDAKSRLDPKGIERNISYFCSDTIDLSAITFLEILDIGENDLYALIPSIAAQEKDNQDTPEEDSEEGNSNAEEDTEQQADEDENEIFISCEPVLDPVSGVALSDLMIDDIVACRLPEESSFYKFFANNYPEFDGILNGVITGIRMNEHGTATVALKLAEGISGALRLSGKVRIMLIAKGEDRNKDSQQSYVEVFLALASVVVFLSIMGVLLYKLS